MRNVYMDYYNQLNKIEWRLCASIWYYDFPKSG